MPSTIPNNLTLANRTSFEFYANNKHMVMFFNGLEISNRSKIEKQNNVGLLGILNPASRQFGWSCHIIITSPTMHIKAMAVKAGG